MPDGKAEKAASIDSDSLAPAPANPLIFISHDTRDAELAESFSKLLGSVSCGVLKSFRSSDRKGSQGIEYGIEWYPALMERLTVASDVVCLLTQHSLDRPWILYEAGVAKGKLNTPVYGVALGIPLGRASSGPFAQFQNCDDNEESLTKLVMQLVKRIPNSEPDRDAIALQVKGFKEKVAQILKATPTLGKKADKPEVDETSSAKLFEEIKLMFQDLPSRIDGRVSEAMEPRRKRRRMHPMMIDEMLHMSGLVEEPVGLLLMLSFVREDMPWIYEAGLELYRSMRKGSTAEVDRNAQQFLKVVDVTARGPWAEDFSGSKDNYMFIREMPHTFGRFMHRYMRSRGQKKEKVAS